MTFKWAWDVAASVKRRGGRFELTPARDGFYIRGTQATAEELAWIRQNRDRMLQHVQHLLPVEGFKQLQRSGALNIGRKSSAETTSATDTNHHHGRRKARQNHLR